MVFAVQPAMAESQALTLLKQAKKEESPSAKIEILDRAMRLPRLTIKQRGLLHFERGLAYKQLHEYTSAINDFNLALAHGDRSVDVLLEKADCMILAGQLGDASLTLEKILAKKPGIARCYVLKATVYEKQGFFSKAEDEYSRALHYNPYSTFAREMRAKAFLRSGRPRKALDDVNELARLERHRPELFLLKARIHAKLKEYGEALRNYDDAGKLMKDSGVIAKEKAQVNFKAGQPAKALETLTAYLEKNPDDLDAKVLSARAQIELNQVKEAEKKLASVLATKPTHPGAHLYLGLLSAVRKRWDLALAGFNRALELDPSLVDAYKERAQIFMKLHEPVRAYADLTSAARLDPSDGEIYVVRARSCLERRLYRLAVKDYSRALDRLPNDIRILYERAHTHYLRDDFDSALTDLNHLLEIRPDSGEALSLRGIVRFQAGDVEHAREDFGESARKSPQDPMVWCNKGFFLYKTGSLQPAIEDLNKALQLDPTHQKARYNLTLVLSKIDTSAPDQLTVKPPGGAIPDGTRPEEARIGETTAP